MPGPPTPIYGCALRQVDIQSSLSSRTFESIPASRPLTLTLEWQRRDLHDDLNLVLVIHTNSDHLLSIKLCQLLKSTDTRSGAISIERHSFQLRIYIQQQQHTIFATFVEERDFNVTVCTLKKMGFAIHRHQSILALETSDTSPGPQTSNFPFNHVLGPRLSSIPPLPPIDPRLQPSPEPLGPPSSYDFNETQPTQQQDSQNGFGALWSGRFRGAGGRVVAASPAACADRSTPQLMQMPHLGPSNAILGRQNHENFIPRVSSPLRNATQPVDIGSRYPTQDLTLLSQSSNESALPQTQPIEAEVHSDTQYGLEAAGEGLEPTHPNVASSQNHNIIGHSSQESSSEAMQDFRKLMPEPRTLPFATQTKKRSKSDHRMNLKARRVESCPDTVPLIPRAKPKQAMVRGSNPKGKLSQSSNTMDNEDTTITTQERATDDTSNYPDASAAVAQLVKSQERSPAKTSTTPPLTETECEILVTDYSVLRELSDDTSNIFDQYEADVERGCDKAACAQYYMDQVLNARRDFWYSKLSAMNGEAWLAPIYK